MKPRQLHIGDIMQISPDGGRGMAWFGGCLFIVSEPKSWGAQGYVKNAGTAGQAYYRATWDEMEPTGGKVVWAPRTEDPIEPPEDSGRLPTTEQDPRHDDQG